MLGESVGSLPKNSTTEPVGMGLSTLPYDLLLNIATYLDLRDVHALHLVSSSLVLRAGMGHRDLVWIPQG